MLAGGDNWGTASNSSPIHLLFPTRAKVRHDWYQTQKKLLVRFDHWEVPDDFHLHPFKSPEWSCQVLCFQQSLKLIPTRGMQVLSGKGWHSGRKTKAELTLEKAIGTLLALWIQGVAPKHGAPAVVTGASLPVLFGDPERK